MKNILIRYADDKTGELVEVFFEEETVEDCITKFKNEFLKSNIFQENNTIPECFEIYELIGYHDPYNDN